MSSIERPGINPIWLSNWKSLARSNKRIQASNGPENIQDLEYYALHGVTSDGLRCKPAEQPVILPYRNWERYLEMYLTTYAHYLIWSFEPKCIAEQRFDTDMAMCAFAAMYPSQIIGLRRCVLSPRRFPGRTLHNMGFDALAYTALGVIVGCREQAFRLARMQLAGYRKGFYDDNRDHYPAYHFLLRILNDHFGEPPLPLRGEAAQHPVFNALYEVWREPDPQTLVPVVLAACDEHTRRYSGVGPSCLYREFDDFMRTPVPILLLFKLRDMHGLANPQIDHPLMTTALGALPPEVAFAPDDLIGRVSARMMQDGYDEDAIAAEVFADLPAYTAAAAIPTAVRLRGVTPDAPHIPPWHGDLASLKLREFAFPAFGLSLKAPADWQETSEGNLFGVLDAQNDVQFTASAYLGPFGYIETWAKTRFEAVAERMPFLQRVIAPYDLKGQGWEGIAAEYQGIFPDEDYETSYLVLCLQNDETWISLTVVGSAAAFAANEGLYRWLLTQQLRLVAPGKRETELLGTLGNASDDAVTGLLDRIKGWLGRGG